MPTTSDYRSKNQIEVLKRYDSDGTVFYSTEIINFTQWGEIIEHRYFTIDENGKASPYTPSNIIWKRDRTWEAHYMSAYRTERIEDPF